MAEAADPVVIVSAVRSPLGRFMGELSPLPAHKLGSHVIGAALERAKLAPEKVDEVFMGCVLPAGQGQAPARQAARAAGLPDATGATTVNKVCGSGMKATMLAHDIIRAGSAKIVVSGGMESMSNAPYLLAKARGGYRAGHDRIIDHMMMDGLEDAYETGRSMGDFGEATAEAYQFTRKDQDAFAMETLNRARKAVEGGAFKAEIAPITLSEKAGPRIVANDEHPLKVDPAKIPGLKPAFRANGTITPAASSANADGAAALVLTSARSPIAAACRLWLRSGATPPIAKSRNGSPRPRSRRSASCSTRSAGAPTTSTCSRSTKPSPWWRWRRSAISAFPARSSTSTAARARSAIPSAPPAHG